MLNKLGLEAKTDLKAGIYKVWTDKRSPTIDNARIQNIFLDKIKNQIIHLVLVQRWMQDVCHTWSPQISWILSPVLDAEFFVCMVTILLTRLDPTQLTTILVPLVAHLSLENLKSLER